jgi:hypothetical protein
MKQCYNVSALDYFTVETSYYVTYKCKAHYRKSIHIVLTRFRYFYNPLLDVA